MTRLLLLAAVALVAVLAAGMVSGAGAAWDVYPGEGTPIQDAVDGAGVGDTIFVHAGTYIENLDVDKRLTLNGESADVVMVTANSSNDHVFEVTADHVNISGFTVTGAKDSGKAGIHLIGVNRCNISGNNASGNRCGIYLNFSNYNTLSNNTANLNSGYGGYGKHGYSYGICLNSSSNNILTNNTANSNRGRGTNDRYHDGGDGYGYGIHLCYSSNNTLTNNNASSNIGEGGMGGKYGSNGRGYGYGIYLNYSSNNTLTGNTANSNSYYTYKRRYYGSGYGIYLNDSSSNMLYYNSFADNIHDALDHCNNTWDDGTEGNYYSKYTGTDLNDDGIGDTAYAIPGDGGSVDNFPLARPWEGHRVSAEVLTVCSSGCDYTRIQDAVDAADEGDTIFVYNGSYTENVLVNQRLKLRGEGVDVVTVRAVRSGHEVFEVTADRVDISGFTVTGATGSNVAGIRLHNADHCVISENNAHGNCEGIRLQLSSNNTIINNTLNSNNRCGVRFLAHSNNNVIKDNSLNANGEYGIDMYSSHNTLTGNTLDSNGKDGIYITDSSNNTLVNNTANSNEYCGIHLYSYKYKYPSNKYNTLTGNTANSNGEYGIHIDASVGNIIVNNTANSNRDGIHIDHVSSINNTIHHNSFADSTRYDAYDACHDSDYHHRTNTWDNGTEGNYCSDYPGIDADGNGIGDTPHSIPRSDGNMDNYPLMQAWNGYQVHNLNTNETFLGIQAAIDDSDTDDGHTITVGGGVYRMNVNVNKRLTMVGAGADVVTVIASPLSDYSFDVTANYVNISGFMAIGAISGKGFHLNGTDHCNIYNNIASNNEYGIYLNFSRSITLANNAMSENTYNFALRAGSPSEYIHNIETSNTVNGKPIYYWVDQRDKIIPKDAGYVGVVNSTNITVRDLTLTRNGRGVLFAHTMHSTIWNVTVNSNKDYGIYMLFSDNNMLTGNTANSNHHGIYMTSSSDNTLTDTNASSNEDYGIYLEDSSSNTLTGNTANRNRHGIYLNSSSNNVLVDTNASSNEDCGAHLLDSNNNILHNITANRNRHGIHLNSSNGNALRNNSISDGSYGINLYSSINNTLSGNIIHLTDRRGITLDESGNNMVTNNAANSNEEYGLYMSSSSSNTITGNTMSSNDCGIYLNSSSDNTIANNNASSNVDHGIHLCYSSNNKLIGNIANRNEGDVGHQGHSNCDWNHLFAGNGGNGYGYGIHILSSNNNTLTKNTANLNGGRGGDGGGGSFCYYGGDGGNGYGYGICLSSSNNNMLTGNIANLNCGRGGAGGSGGGRIGSSTSGGGGGGDGGNGYGYGICLSSSSNNMLTGNTANSNSGDGGRGGRALDIDAVAGSSGGDYGYGICIRYSSSNTLYYNNLANDSPHNAYDTGTNTWDSGSAGNYYSDYTGTDPDGDGIGDDPHQIPGGGNVDNYPLMQPWTATAPQKGDLNGNDQITPADAAIALQIAAGGSASCDPTTLAAADVSGDGRVTSLDALMILKAAANAIEL